MATTKGRAEAFVREVTKAAHDCRERLGIDRNDIHHVIRVTVTDQITYNEHEDED